MVSLLHVGPTQVSLCHRLPESHVCVDKLKDDIGDGENAGWVKLITRKFPKTVCSCIG